MKRFAPFVLALSFLPGLADQAEAGILRGRHSGGDRLRIGHRQRSGHEGQRIFHWPRICGARHCGG